MRLPCGNGNYLFNEAAKNILSEEIKNELNRMWWDRHVQYNMYRQRQANYEW